MNAADSIRKHEGYREIPYRDHLGNWTVGYGILLERMPMPTYHRTLGEFLDWLTDPNVHEGWFEKRLAASQHAAKEFAAEMWDSLSEARRNVLIEMAFQLGRNGLLRFVKFRAATRRGHWVEAHAHMLDSRWAQQTPKRAQTLADMYLEG